MWYSAGKGRVMGAAASALPHLTAVYQDQRQGQVGKHKRRGRRRWKPESALRGTAFQIIYVAGFLKSIFIGFLGCKPPYVFSGTSWLASFPDVEFAQTTPSFLGSFVLVHLQPNDLSTTSSSVLLNTTNTVTRMFEESQHHSLFQE